MKKLLLLLLTAAVPFVGNAHGYRIVQGDSHPRLIIDAPGFADIMRKTTSDSASHRFLRDVSSSILSRAEQLVASPVDFVYSMDASNKRILHLSNAAVEQLSVLSYACRITGDNRYSDLARKVMSQVCSFKDWNPSHFLDAGEMCLAVSIAYDWLYDRLTPDERSMAETAITEKCLKPGLASTSFYDAPYNWNQVCNAGMVAGALALYEKDTAFYGMVLDKSIESNRRMVVPMYSPDGNYAEGYGYWIYGSSFQAVLMRLLETALGTTFGIEDTPGLLESARYMQFMAGPCGNFSYADGGGGGGVGYATGMWWFAHRSNDLSLLAGEVRNYMEGKEPRFDGGRLRVLIPAIAKDMDVDAVSSVRPEKDIWSGRGQVPVVMVHTGWKNDANDHYLGFKGGPASSNHGHMDAGSFVYDALGERWSSDLPCPSYTGVEIELGKVGKSYWDVGQLSGRWDMFELNSMAHSTLVAESGDTTIKRTHPTDFNVFGKAEITEVIEEENRLGGVVDMTAPLQGQVRSAVRTIVLENNKDLVITDVITASSDTRITWHMVTAASVSVSGDCEVLTLNGKTMYMSVKADIPFTYISDPFRRPAEWEQHPTWDAISNANWNKYTLSGYKCTVPAGSTVKLVTVLSPDRPEQH